MTTCPHCKVEFETKIAKQIYCCREHGMIYRKEARRNQVITTQSASEAAANARAKWEKDDNWLYLLRMAEVEKFAAERKKDVLIFSKFCKTENTND